MCIIPAFVLGLLILNTNLLWACHCFWTIYKANKSELELRYIDLYEDDGISCKGDDKISCSLTDEFGLIHFKFITKLSNMFVLCAKSTRLNFNKFARKSHPLRDVNCDALTYKLYTDNDKTNPILAYVKEQNKLTLIYNTDISTEPTEYFFQYLRQLHMDIRSSANIITLPKNIFSFFLHSKLETLTIITQSLTHEHIMLQNLTQEHFQNFTALKYLDLAGNNMKVLDANIFETLTNLNCLNLSRNEISELQPNIFGNQRQLIILDLSNNLLTYLPSEIFKQNSWLWQLKLSGNRLIHTTNVMATLKPLKYLHRLDLRENKLQTVWEMKISSNSSISSKKNSNVEMNLALAEGLNYIIKLAPEKYKESNFYLKIFDLSRNLLNEFNMDWFVNAGIKCPFQINLEQNLIKNIYSLSNLLTATEDCEREIKMAGNPMMCDCKLAWIFNDNLHTLFSDLKCNQTSTKLLTDIAQLERNELCAWQPVMCPKKCNCYIQSKSLIINCYDGQLDVIEQLPRPEQVSLTSSILDIRSNNFTVLPLNTTFGYANVSQLYASNNKITNISLFQLPTNLTSLDLRNNYLKSLSTNLLRAILNDSSKLETLYLSENLWFCDCAARDLMYTVRAHRKRIPDVEQLQCVNLQNVTLLTANVGELCQTAVNVERYHYMIAIGTTVAVIIIILLIIAALYYKYQTEVKVWLYGHNIFSCCIHESELDENKTFDAFISYSHQDADFVNHTLLPQLEQGEPPFCACTHERNWLAGAYIPEQIIESVDQSRRTIIVLSQHFIESDWARMEFRTAHQCSMKEGRARIIMIKYGELTNTEFLDKDLKAYLDMNTYLDWQDPRFWDKLRYAMPHKMGRERNADMLHVGGRMYVMGQVEMNNIRDDSA